MTQSILLIKDMLCPHIYQGCGLLGYWQPGDWTGGGFFVVQEAVGHACHSGSKPYEQSPAGMPRDAPIAGTETVPASSLICMSVPLSHQDSMPFPCS